MDENLHGLEVLPPHDFPFQIPGKLSPPLTQQNTPYFVIDFFGIEHEPIHVEYDSLNCICFGSVYQFKILLNP
jgi:hypothetical protein